MQAGDLPSAVSYPLSAKVEYLRRHDMVSMLFSLAQAKLRDPRAWEQVHILLTGDGDYKATVVVDDEESSIAQAEGAA